MDLGNGREMIGTLESIATRVSTVKTLPDLAGAIEAIVDDLVQVEHLGVFLLDPQENRLKLLVAKGFTEAERAEAERTAMDRHVGQVFVSRQILHVPDTEQDPEASTTSKRSFEIRSRLWLPVLHHEECLGCFGLAATVPNAFSEEHIHLLRFAGNMAGVVYHDILSRRELQKRYELQELLTGISSEFVKQPQMEASPGIEDALGRVGAFAGADRSCLYSFTDDGHGIDSLHQWCSAGTQPRGQSTQGLSSDVFPRWMDQLRRFEHVSIPDVDVLLPGSSSQKKTLKAQEIRSLLVLPMADQGKLTGVFALDWVRASVPLDERLVPLLQLAGNVLFGALNRVRAERERRQSEERYRNLVEHQSEGLAIVDPHEVFTFANPAAHSILGVEQGSLLGRSLAHFLDEEALESVRAQTEVHKGGRETTYEIRLTRPDGAQRTIRVTGKPEYDDAGRFTGTFGVFRDITERRRLEEERLRLRKLESVGLLAGGIAHDFNNLLTGLFGNIEMAKMLLSADHKAHRFLESAGSSLESATNLTRQLLTFARGGDPVKETLSIGDTIVEMAQFSLRGSNVKLRPELAPDLWPVDADKGQLSQVISNLIINAQQAMPTGGTVTLAAQNDGSSEDRHVQISVRDEGVGIGPQYLDKIFDPYFTTKQRGSGLGLASVHSIISRHNGTVTVESNPNEGATFTIRLPAAEPAPPTQTGGPSDRTGAAVAGTARVLVMDDEEAVRGVLEAMLRRLGHEASHALDGREAIEMYQAAQQSGEPYDAVIVDLTVPGGMGGQEATQEILRMDPHAKIIVSSGYSTDPVMADYEDYGFKSRMAKPYRFEDLQKVIQPLLGT